MFLSDHPLDGNEGGRAKGVDLLAIDVEEHLIADDEWADESGNLSSRE